MIFPELPEYIQGHQAQGFLGLHEIHGPVSPRYIIGEIGTHGWSDKLLPVLRRCDRGVELVDGLVAERTIQVEMELYLRPGLDVFLALGAAGQTGHDAGEGGKEEG